MFDGMREEWEQPDPPPVIWTERIVGAGFGVLLGCAAVVLAIWEFGGF